MHKLLLAALAALAWTQASAQVALSFSGGLGSPLTVTVQNDVTFTLTSDGVKHDFLFIEIPGVGPMSEFSVTGSLAYTTNGGAPNTFEMGTAGMASGHLGITLWRTGSTWQATDEVVLHAGSFTTGVNYLMGAPSAGSYNLYLADNMGTFISAAGTVSAVPEPSTYAAIFGALALSAVAVVRRRRAAVLAQN